MKAEDAHLPLEQLEKYLHILIDRYISAHSDSFVYNSSDELMYQSIYHANSYNNLYLNLKSYFQRVYNKVVAETPAAENKDAILSRIDSFIRKNCFEPLNNKILADKFGFTPAYLSKLFLDYKQISPMDYILQLRMEKAKELFQNSPQLMIKDVSAHVGYPDSLYFSKVFKKYTGKSPKQYIRQYHPYND